MLPRLTPLVRSYLIALVALFVIGAVLENVMHAPVTALLVLNPRSWTWLTPIQVFTHLWVVPPEGFISLVVGCAMLWWIVPPLEQRYGTRRLLELTLIAGIADALPALAVAPLLPDWSSISFGPGAITLCIVAAHFALVPLDQQVSFFFLPPNPLKHLLLGLLGAYAILAVSTHDLTTFASALGVVGAGALYGRRWLLRPIGGGRGPARKAKRRGGPKLRIVRSRDDDDEGSGPKRWLN